MKESKAIHVTKHKIRDDHNLVYQLHAKHKQPEKYDTNNFGCQYDSKLNNPKNSVICTCKNKNTKDMRYFSVSKQIYAYHGSRSYTDIGVGSVKAMQKRKVRRVYLPETDDRGVGSSDLSSYVIRKNKQQKPGYYDQKKTSSKCVGGILEYNSLISQKLSPFVQTRSGSTSPKMSIDMKNIEIGSNTVDKSLVTIGTQFEIEKKEEAKEEKVKTDKETEPQKKLMVKVSEQTQKYKYSTEMQSNKRTVIERRVKEVDKVYSSDSLVQHVHNLESPSDEKHSRGSIDPMENKLEREYRRMFSTKDRGSKPSIDKPVPEFKSASVLRRRFEALRRGLKKDDGKKNTMASSQDSVPSRKDASVTSDPPSLEGRSYTDTKIYSPIQANVEHNKNKIRYKRERDSSQWPQSEMDSEYQGVKGMFNLWGKKFKFEDDADKAKATPKPSLAIDINKKPQKETKAKKEVDSKKSGRKFFFFRKKSKDQKIDQSAERKKEIYNPSGVTAGRCEIRDGLMMKIGGSKPSSKVSKISEEGDDILRRTWFKNFLTNTITSARSVNVRWNNSMYATSSSTVFELMDTIYKNNGVVLKSRSEITSEESSYYKSYTKNKVNFEQKIEAWMIPRTIPDRPREIPIRIQSNREIKERDVSISDQRWFIEKSKAFANKIEVVLHSNNFNRLNNSVSSEYLRIDIPKDFFDISSSDGSKQNHTSDEEVYKIVEYESDLTDKTALERGDHTSEIKVLVNVQDSNMEAEILDTVIKRAPMHRDVVIQGSNVIIPKRCDVIGVGIITRRDLRDIRKPILKIHDDLTDEESEDERLLTNSKKCEFAESYLQEYYQQWTPLGIDLFSWCVSDSHLRSCSEKSLISFHNQGDGSKSCPNIFEDYQTSTVISSCNTSSCSQCYEDDQKDIEKKSFSAKFFKKFKKPSKATTDTDIAKRVLPKDSLEVFKRRKIYAASLKSRWACSEDKPVSVPSIESKGAQNTFVDCPKLEEAKCKPPKPKTKMKLCKKHVSMPDYEKMNDDLADQLAYKKPEGILAFKGDVCKRKGNKGATHAIVKENLVCEIPPSPEPPCLASCEKEKNPPCDKTKKSSPVNCLPTKKSPPLQSPKQHSQPCPCSPPSPKHCKARRNASPIIQCRSPCSPSPNGSGTIHTCLSPAQSPIPQNEKRCPKCQHKMPCRAFPNCKLSLESLHKSSESPQKETHPCQQGMTLIGPAKGSPKKSPKKGSPCNLPPCSLINKQSDSECPPKSTSPHSHVNKKPDGCPAKSSPHTSPPRSPVKKKPDGCPAKSSPHTSPPRSPVKKKPDGCPAKSSPHTSPPRSPVKKKPDGCPAKSSPHTSPPRSPVKKKPDGCPAKSSPHTSPPRSPVKKKSDCKCPVSAHPTSSPCKLCKKSSDSASPPKSTPPKSPCESVDFPWPTNSQNSNPPSPSCTDTSMKKDKNKCKKKCPLMPKMSDLDGKLSCQSLAPIKVKECKPNCASKKKKERLVNKIPESPKIRPEECPENRQQPCPTKQQQPCPAKPQQSQTTPKRSAIGIGKAKVSGLFLKMKPFKKTCSKDCLAWDSKGDGNGIVKLNSRENMIINMKEQTPSTEEIRKSMNIKVQDDDGNTLFERKDYTCTRRPSVLYKDSKINRVSTPVMLVTNDDTANNKKEEVTECKSETSLANLIEIQFKLRITQGDKTTEVSIANEDEEKEHEVNKTSPEVFVVEREGKEPGTTIEENAKNDISIKIIVKNYKPKPNKIKEPEYNDDYTKKISEKFHTVSTGYSDIQKDLDDDNVFSIHRATIDLDSSDDKSKTLSKLSNEVVSEELNEPIDFMVSSHSTEHFATDVTEDEKTVSSKKDTQSYEKYGYTNETTKDTDTDLEVSLELTSNEHFDTKYNSKEEKKQLLKKVFEKVYTKPKNTENVRELRDTLKVIFTDDNDERNAVSNELAKDITYASLKPDFFRNTDSMNNYYKMDSSFTIEGSKVTSNILYPTGENSSMGTARSLKSCICSRLAEKLNCDLKIGCCCRQTRVDKITSCTGQDEDIMLLNHRTVEYVDVDTQSSKHLSNKSNSLDLSMHSRDKAENETDKISIHESSVSTKDSTKKRVMKTFSPHKSHIKGCEMKRLNRMTVLGISDDDKIVLLSEEAVRRTASRKKEKERATENNFNVFNAADVLQCYETKKAVLEIYAEKTMSENGEHFVAKLPKFVYERESEITRMYEQISTNSYKSVCRRNVFRMSVNG